MPFASAPDVIINLALTTFPSCNSFPNTPSPKINSYCSPDTSCKKKIFDPLFTTRFESLSNKLSWRSYLTETVESNDGDTFTTNVSKSIPVFGKINFWFGLLDANVNTFSNKVPS